MSPVFGRHHDVEQSFPDAINTAKVTLESSDTRSAVYTEGSRSEQVSAIESLGVGDSATVVSISGCISPD
jgi:hypothetical protein